MFVIGGDYQFALDEYQKKIRSEKYEDEVGLGTQARFHAHAGKKTGLIWFKHDKPSIGVIAHECFHAVSYMLEMSGFKMTIDSDEAYAYGLEFLCEHVDKFLKSKVKLKKVL